MKMNAAQLNSRSITLEKTASSVALLKYPSQAKAQPQAKADRRSSQPSSVDIPGSGQLHDVELTNCEYRQTDILGDEGLPVD
jgi:hypothetical protein